MRKMKHHPATQKRTNCRASIEMCPLIGFKIAFPPGHFTIPTEQEKKKWGNFGAWNYFGQVFH